MPTLVVDAGGLTGRLREGAEARVIASLPAGHTGGRVPVIDAVHVFFHLEPPAPGVVPNIDPWRGYGGDELKPNGEGAHPHDDATGHVTRTHEDFGPRLDKKHITDLPSWGNPDGGTP